MWTFLGVQLINLLISFAGSFLVVVVLCYALRPRVKISEEISYFNQDNTSYFGFKFVNFSWFKLLDVEVFVELMEQKQVTNGPVVSATPVAVQHPRFLIIQRYRKKDKQAEYAFRIKVMSTEFAAWDDAQNYVRVRVVGRHGLSGIYDVAEQSYYKKSAIKQGQHKYGKDLTVEEDPK